MVKNDYKNWSKDDLVKEIDRLRKRKKYGLVKEVRRKARRINGLESFARHGLH